MYVRRRQPGRKSHTHTKKKKKERERERKKKEKKEKKKRKKKGQRAQEETSQNDTMPRLVVPVNPCRRPVECNKRRKII